MTETYGIFDSAEGDTREFSAATLSNIFAKFLQDGIVHDEESELAVSASDPAAMSVVVGTGIAIVQGRYYVNDADLGLDIEPADASYPRIDRIVLQLIATPSRRINATVKKGTAATSPTAPALTRTSEIWELSLAQIAVGAGVTSISSANITDERGNASLCGVAVPAYVPSSQFAAIGNVSFGGYRITDLAAPTADNDATRKAWVLAQIAAAIASFSLSDIEINANKDMGGYKFTNMPSIGIKAYIRAINNGDPIVASRTSNGDITLNSNIGTSTVTVNLFGAGVYNPTTGVISRVFTLLKNDVSIGTYTQNSGAGTSLGAYTLSVDTSANPGDKFTYTLTGPYLSTMLGSIAGTIIPIVDLNFTS